MLARTQRDSLALLDARRRWEGQCMIVQLWHLVSHSPGSRALALAIRYSPMNTYTAAIAWLSHMQESTFHVLYIAHGSQSFFPAL